MSTGDYGCCDTLNHLTAEPRLAGHHALCPRFGLAALERRIAEDEAAPFGERVKRCYQTIEDRAVLVQALREERSARAVERAEWQEAERVQVDEVARLRALMAELADEMEYPTAEWAEVCTVAARRLRAALKRPAGTLTSLPVDGDCDGSDR